MMLIRYRKFHEKCLNHVNPFISFVYRQALQDARTRSARNVRFMLENLSSVQSSFSNYLNENEPTISALKELIAGRDGSILLPNLGPTEINIMIHTICTG